jgi:hypothetical protein
MHIAGLYLWEFAVAIAIFGIGASALRMLRMKNAPLALSGSFGVALLLVLGTWLNLLHLLRAPVFFAIVGIGVVLALFEIVGSNRRSAEVRPRETHTQFSKWMFGAAIVVLGTLLLGYLHPLIWNGDDLQGYVPFAEKALQLHSLQPDPFSERRITTGIGGAIFLDAFMFANGDVRAMPFIDSVFGFFLYIFSFWTLGHLWKVPRSAIAFALLCLPLATLEKVNLTIIYLTSAACLSILLVFAESEAGQGFSWNRALVIGILTGGLISTKSTNIVFVFPLIAAIAVLYKLFSPKSKVFFATTSSIFLAVLIAIPWAIAQKANAGTLLFPLLGKGFHASTYNLVSAPGAAGWKTLAFVTAAPGFILLLVALVIAWKLTEAWNAPLRASAVGFVAAAAVAVPAIALGTGGEAVDRYTAPFAMPALLLVLLIVLGALRLPRLRRWSRLGAAWLLIAGLYTALFVGVKLHVYTEFRVLAYAAIDRLPPRHKGYEYPQDPPVVQQESARARKMQQTIPPGATVLESMQYAYPLDFQRNRIYIADFPGMAGLPPGMPIEGGAVTLRQYLASEGIDYIVIDRRLQDAVPIWNDYLRDPHPRFPLKVLLRRPAFAHTLQPWGVTQWQVASHERHELGGVLAISQVVYDDGVVAVARIH